MYLNIWSNIKVSLADVCIERERERESTQADPLTNVCVGTTNHPMAHRDTPWNPTESKYMYFYHKTVVLGTMIVVLYILIFTCLHHLLVLFTN